MRDITASANSWHIEYCRSTGARKLFDWLCSRNYWSS